MEEIRRLIDERYKTFFGKDNMEEVDKNWFYDFAEFLKRSNISDEQIKEIIEVMMDDRSLDNMKEWEMSENNFSSYKSHVGKEKNFFDYLNSISSKITQQYVLDGIEFAKRNLQANSNFMASFIKYTVITNFEDIRVDSDVPVLKKDENECVSVSCKLGEFKLANIIVKKGVGIDCERIKFDGVLTMANLRNAKLGALLFRKLQGDVAQYFPGQDLYADTIDPQNYRAIRFYKSIGAEIIKPEVIDDNSSYTAFFPADKLQELSKIPVEPPQLEYYSNLQTEGSPARALREYIGNLIKEQRKYIDAEKEVPVNLRIPEQIEISPCNLDYLLKNEIVDDIEQGKTEDEIKFLWKETEEYPELELRIKPNNKGKYVLTHIREKSKDGKEEFVWDSDDKEGKKGILIISRKDDVLDELIDMDK